MCPYLYLWSQRIIIVSLAEVYYFNSTVCSAISLCKRRRHVKNTISFMWGCGDESNSCQDHFSSATTQDWELKVDLGKQLKFSGNNNLKAGHGADLRSLQAGGSHRGGQIRGKVDEKPDKWVASDVWTDWGGMQRAPRQDPQQAGLSGDQQAKGHQICHQGN